jgi:hypothetical protein
MNFVITHYSSMLDNVCYVKLKVSNSYGPPCKSYFDTTTQLIA